MRILITRPESCNNPILQEKLSREFRIHVDILELAKIEPIYINIEKAIQIIPEFEYICWTSQNGVEVFFTYLLRKFPDRLEIFREKILVAIGPMTAQKLKDFLDTEVIIPEKYESDFLRSMIIELKNRCLILRSALAKPMGLPNAYELHIYTLIKKENIYLPVQRYDYIILTSAFLTKLFFEVVRIFPEKAFVPIGPVTYRELEKHVDKSLIIKYPSSYTIKDTIRKILS
ncbi:MAG: uroporphyrinogen-III synthase [Candidatus Calescibacterium sp.]|nr:uroporphyrinogen-III synthase [Candidatus Calescibacterium sp.]MCX7971743.1 uroporphyrinogen-III synthase [bacterium]MDW8195349.1 uroporphyrinogen-III synthase [Candidatus Calescibacterium sp.]